jgi:hypothetical protein
VYSDSTVLEVIHAFRPKRRRECDDRYCRAILTYIYTELPEIDDAQVMRCLAIYWHADRSIVSGCLH